MSDDQSDQKHPIERLLEKPLRPSTESVQYEMPPERLGGFVDLEVTAMNRSEQPETSNPRSHFHPLPSQSLTPSRETTASGKTLSAADDEALAWFDVSLSSGTALLLAMVKRMTAQGLDARRLYQLAVDARQAVRAQSGLPPQVLPTWEQIAASPLSCAPSGDSP